MGAGREVLGGDVRRGGDGLCRDAFAAAARRVRSTPRGGGVADPRSAGGRRVVVGRRLDPVTGKIYHTTFSPAESDEVSARLTQQVEDSFKSAVETGVAAHAEMIGTRLNAQLEERLNLARETVASLGVLKGEMKSIGKSLAADNVEADLSATKLPRHSILEGM